MLCQPKFEGTLGFLYSDYLRFSSEVRAALAAGRGGEGFVHREVLAYIERHGLYRTA